MRYNPTLLELVGLIRSKTRPIETDITNIETSGKLGQTSPDGLVATYTYDVNDVLTQILWVDLSIATIRTDVFTYAEDLGAGTDTTTEVRTLNTGETLTIVTVFNTADGRILSNTSTLNLAP